LDRSVKTAPQQTITQLFRTFSSIAVLIIVLALSSCQSNVASPPSGERLALTFMAGYKPQANLPFVAVYAAQELGYFDREGLDVTIEHSPGGGEHLQLLATGKIQVTTQDAAVLLKRRADPGLPLVSFALIGQDGQQAFAALSSSGFTTPCDWEGAVVGYKGTPPPDLMAILQASGANPDRIELVNVGFDPRVLTEGLVDVYPLFKSNEPFLIQQWGYDLSLWEAADFNIPSLGLTYVTSDAILEAQPEMISRFTRAVLDGIDYAVANPQEAAELVLKYAGPETSVEHMRFMLESELEDLHSEVTLEHGIGWHDQAEWQALADLLVEAEAMPAIDISQVFTNQVLEQIYTE
jgi:ABC-type nitrate/sulfonate/bicarbonate transport system substrate-binding protein